MDLQQFAPGSSFDVILVNPADGKDLGLTIKILGRDSDAFVSLQREQEKARLDKVVVRQGKVVQNQQSLEQFESDRLELLIACTLGWTTADGTMLQMGGADFPFNAANAHTMYSTIPFIREQIQEAMFDRANFFVKPVQPSSTL